MLFQLDFGTAPPALPRNPSQPCRSSVEESAIDSVGLTRWEEHCLECAQPDCYTNCPLYSARADGNCKRFNYGIFADPDFSGALNYGADMHFRRWGKLQTSFHSRFVPLRRLRSLAAIDRTVTGFLGPVTSDDSLRFTPTRRLAHRAYSRARELLPRFLGRRTAPQEFLLEAWNPAEKPVVLNLDVLRGETNIARQAIHLDPGNNVVRIPVSSLGLDRANLEPCAVLLRIYPERDAEARVIFRWLNFICYGSHATRLQQSTGARIDVAGVAPAPKVKCVIWDLDNTIWDGILVDDGPDALRLRPAAAEVIKELDNRGVLHSVASKNDHGDAFPVLERFGLSEYFLYPAIGWGQKSESVKLIAAQLNLGTDAFAFIDDSPFERAEVAAHVPGLRVYSDADVTSLLGRPEFDVPITEESKRRRHLYQVEAERKRVEVAFGDHHVDFLRDCRIEAELFIPHSDSDIERCVELLQRTNQLNLSARRFDRSQFAGLLGHPQHQVLALRARDRFGEYGIVGVITMSSGTPSTTVEDFVLSCRVASRKVEHAVFSFLRDRMQGVKHRQLAARYVRTPRNQPLLAILHEIGFCELEPATDDGALLYLGTDSTIPFSDLVAVTASIQSNATVMP